MGIPLVAGREFNLQDIPTAAPVLIVNETMARRFWPNRNPLGSRLRFPLGDSKFTPDYEVVGVVKDSKYTTLGERPQPFFYDATLQRPPQQTVLHVRTTGDPNKMRAAVRNAVSALDRTLLVEVDTMQENLKLSVLPARIAASLLGLLGLLGLSLALVGVYGVISYSVLQRTREIGLRMALGARPLTVFRMVIGPGMKLTLVGIVLGTASALGLTRFLSSLLVGVSPVDPLTFATLIALFVVVALLACYLPARRATRVDPMVALRHE